MNLENIIEKIENAGKDVNFSELTKDEKKELMLRINSLITTLMKLSS